MRKSVRMGVRGTVAVLAASSAAFIVPQVAQAAPPKCLDQHVCVYENKDFTGGFQQFALSHDNLHIYQYDNRHPLADSITSVFNNTNVVVCYYRDVGFHGINICDLPGGYRKNLLIESQARINNAISSIRVG